MSDYKPGIVLPAAQYKVVGTRPIRHDGLDKVTGRAKYGVDVEMAGLLHGKVLRSPHTHARILSIDTRKAEALTGVKAVVTARDVPLIQTRKLDLGAAFDNMRILAENVMASERVLYQGHALAAVAATSPHIAEEALKLIQVDYEALPAILDMQEAMKPGAPLLHESMTTQSLADKHSAAADTGVRSNIGRSTLFQRGDLERGFLEASIIVEREFTTKQVHQGYIEAHSSVAYWAPDGHVTIWTSTQAPFLVRSQTAAILGLPESWVKIIPMEIGGGFGGKTLTYLDALATLLSGQSGHPVKMVMTRKEVFEGSGPAPAASARCKIGADRHGRITAGELEAVFEAGAFPGASVAHAATTSFARYRMEHLRVDVKDVVVNKQKAAGYRAPCTPQAAFAVEVAIDELAEKLGMDPLEFRLKNAAREGDRQPSGVPFGSIGYVEVVEAMKADPHYNTPLGGPHRGRGVATGALFAAGFQSSATISVNSDGTISLITGSVDIGGSRTAMAMQAAEVLGLAAEDVVPTVGDTDSVGWTMSTGGSRSTFSTGIAVVSAAEEVKRQMMARAALLWEVKPEDVEYVDGLFVNANDWNKKISLKELAGKLRHSDYSHLFGPVTASAASDPRGLPVTFVGLIVDVEVDPETGKVIILRCTVFQDVGRAIHPSYAEGQMQGGTVQGIGWALNEEYFYNRDRSLANSSFLDYRMPTALDLPMIDTVMVEVHYPGHPLGVRGIGEASIIPPLAAVANAIYRAVGVRMTKLPLSPSAILEALKGNGMGWLRDSRGSETATSRSGG